MRKLFLAQIILIIVAAAVCSAIDIKAVPSVLYGGAACFLPNLYFASRFFACKHTKRPGQILMRFYMGEFFKMIISAVIIILAVMYLNALLLPTVLGYFIANLAFWMAPALVLKKKVGTA